MKAVPMSQRVGATAQKIEGSEAVAIAMRAGVHFEAKLADDMRSFRMVSAVPFSVVKIGDQYHVFVGR